MREWTGQRIRRLVVGISTALAVMFAMPSFAGTVSAEAIIDALRRDPSSLPSDADVPYEFQYIRGSEQRVSADDRDGGVLAYFVMTVNYKNRSITEGITFRVFRDLEAAENYWRQMSIFNKPNFKEAPGTEFQLKPFITDDYKWPGRRPLSDVHCESFVTASAPNVSETRCYARHADLPVVVSGLRLDPVQSQRVGDKVSYPDWDRLAGTQLPKASLLLDDGIARLEEIRQTRAEPRLPNRCASNDQDC